MAKYGNLATSMKVCVIGANGFMGIHLCEQIFRHTEHSVEAIDTDVNNIIELLTKNGNWQSRLQFHVMDSSNTEKIIKYSDLTFNLAACHKPATYGTSPLQTILKDLGLALEVAVFCSRLQKRLIHVSTYGVYENTLQSHVEENSYLHNMVPLELVTLNSINSSDYGSYAAVKHLIERLVYLEGAKNNLQFTIIRPYCWIGPRLKKMSSLPASDLSQSGDSEKGFVYITDAMKALELIMNNPIKYNGKTINIGHPHGELSGLQLENLMTEVYEKVNGEIPPDMNLINNIDGWTATTTLEELVDILVLMLYENESLIKFSEEDCY